MSEPDEDEEGNPWTWVAGIIATLLIVDLLGAAGLIHPRKCPACQEPYHAGKRCDWSKIT